MVNRLKQICKMLPAIIGMILNLFSFALVIGAYVVESNEVPPATGISLSFSMWVFSFLTAFVSIFLYLIDLYTSFRYLKSRKILLILKIILVFGAIPMVTVIGGRLGICIWIWNIYYAVVFIVELLSFIYVLLEKNVMQSQK